MWFACAAEQEPVQLEARDEHHHHKDKEEDERVSEVAGDAKDHEEKHAEMRRDLRDGEGGGEIPVIPQKGYVLRGEDDVDDLNDLGGLYADAEEAYPAAVARIALGAEGNEQEKERKFRDQQQRPLVGDDIRVDHSEQEVQHDADDERCDLHVYHGGTVVAACGA